MTASSATADVTSMFDPSKIEPAAPLNGVTEGEEDALAVGVVVVVTTTTTELVAVVVAVGPPDAGVVLGPKFVVTVAVTVAVVVELDGNTVPLTDGNAGADEPTALHTASPK